MSVAGYVSTWLVRPWLADLLSLFNGSNCVPGTGNLFSAELVMHVKERSINLWLPEIVQVMSITGYKCLYLCFADLLASFSGCNYVPGSNNLFSTKLIVVWRENSKWMGKHNFVTTSNLQKNVGHWKIAACMIMLSWFVNVLLEAIIYPGRLCFHA